MAIIEMPAYRLGAFRFWLGRSDLLSPEASGVVGGVQMGWPRWMAEYELAAQNHHQAHLWSTWRLSLRGSARLFLASDPSRWLPWAYRAKRHGGGHDGDGGLPGGWNGDASAFSLNGDRSAVTLTVPIGTILTTGDLIGFRWAGGDRHCPVACLTGGVADGAGHVTVTVEPSVHKVVPNDATAYLRRPRFLAKQTGESEDAVMNPDSPGNGKLVCVQQILP